MRRTKSPSVLLDHLAKLMEIFEMKKWPMGDEKSKKGTIPEDSSKNLFMNFCELLAELELEEQELVLKLTEDYLRYTYIDYPVLMSKTLRMIDKEIITNSSKIFILPLVSPKDREKGIVKSAHGMLYQIMHDIIPKDPNLGPIRHKILSLHDVSFLDINHSNRHKSLLLFFDDFIGSGSTACQALWEYWNLYRVDGDTVAVLALVAQKNGISLLRQHYFDNIYAYRIRKRGISDSNKFPDILRPLSIMDSIESKMKVSPKYRRGFGKSEALVTMIRTPNNTFPVYWWSKTKPRKDWPAPFSRF